MIKIKTLKIILSLIILVILFYLIISSISNSKCKTCVVSKNEMVIYGKEFLKTYFYLDKELNLSLEREDTRLISPIYFKAIISKKQGASINFISNSTYKNTVTIMKDRIEAAIVEDMGLFPPDNFPENCPIAIYASSCTHCTFDNNVMEGCMVLQGEKNIAFQNKFINGFFIVNKTSYLFSFESTVNDIFLPGLLLIKGSNERIAWTREVAQNDAKRLFIGEILDSYIQSQEFKEYLATPSLQTITGKILENTNSGVYRQNTTLAIQDINELYTQADKNNSLKEGLIKIKNVLQIVYNMKFTKSIIIEIWDTTKDVIKWCIFSLLCALVFGKPLSKLVKPFNDVLKKIEKKIIKIRKGKK